MALISRRWAIAALLLTGATLPPQVAVRADELDTAKARGTLIVGTKADYRPFGFRDASGAIVGFEPDLAAEVARKLGLKLQLVPVVAAERIKLLTDHTLDLVIATMNATDERRKVIDFIEPSYYASGVNVLAPKSLHLHVWQELRGKPVCTVDGAFYVAEIRQRYEPLIQTFANTDAMYPALRDEKCVAVVYDDTAIIGQLQSPDWRDYEMPLFSILVEPWGMGVAQGETRFEALLSELVREWHRSGRIQELEKHWNIPPSAYADEMHRKYAGE
jgi:polar amino acid transport system substrate-binding protein